MIIIAVIKVVIVILIKAGVVPSVHMRNLLWLAETRLAQNSLSYLNILCLTT